MKEVCRSNTPKTNNVHTHPHGGVVTGEAVDGCQESTGTQRPQYGSDQATYSQPMLPRLGLTTSLAKCRNVWYTSGQKLLASSENYVSKVCDSGSEDTKKH